MMTPGAFLAHSLYKDLKAARFGYTAVNEAPREPDNMRPLEPMTDIVDDQGQADFRAFQGQGVQIG